MVTFKVNGKVVTVDVDAATPVLWALRDSLHMAGTKFGCGLAQCGACTVHVNGQAVRSCVTPVGAVEGRDITTIECMSAHAIGALVQAAWIERDVSQCGYCQSGQIMSAVALLSQNARPTDVEIDVAMNGNICRCGTYGRIRSAIKLAADSLARAG